MLSAGSKSPGKRWPALQFVKHANLLSLLLVMRARPSLAILGTTVCLIVALNCSAFPRTARAESQLRQKRHWLEVAPGAQKDVILQNQAAIAAAIEARVEQARGIWQKLTAAHPPALAPYLNLAFLEESQKRPTQAIFISVCQNKALNENALTGGFELLMGLSRHKQAESYAAALRNCKRLPAPTLEGLAELQLMLGKRRAALDTLDEILSTQPKHARALQLSGLIYMQSGDWRRAVFYLDLAHEADPSLHNLTLARAGSYLQLQEPKRTLSILSEAGDQALSDEGLVLQIRARLLLDWNADLSKEIGMIRSAPLREQVVLELYGTKQLPARETWDSEFISFY